MNVEKIFQVQLMSSGTYTMKNYTSPANQFLLHVGTVKKMYKSS